jgi:hypothetical protein
MGIHRSEVTPIQCNGRESHEKHTFQGVSGACLKQDKAILNSEMEEPRNEIPSC